MIDAPGRALIVWSWRATIIFTITAVAATIDLDQFQWPAIFVAVSMFAMGIIAMLWAYALAVERSRVDAIGVGGLFFAAGSAPKRVQRHLLGSLAIQVSVGLVTASIRTFTTLAFGTLVPLFGLGLTGLWCARHGTFEPTDPPSKTE